MSESSETLYIVSALFVHTLSVPVEVCEGATRNSAFATVLGAADAGDVSAQQLWRNVQVTESARADRSVFTREVQKPASGGCKLVIC